MRHSIYFRNFLVTMITVFLSVSLLGGLSMAWNYRLSASETREDMYATLQQAVRYIAAQFLDQRIEMNDLILSRSLAMISAVSGYELFLTDTYGVISSSSSNDFSSLGKIVPESALIAAASQGSAVIRTDLDMIYVEPRLVAGLPLSVSFGGETFIFGFLFVSSGTDTYGRGWQQVQDAFMLIALGVLLFAIVISYVATKRQAEPLKEMADAARRFARGDFSLRVKDYGKIDEISQLTQAFNAMADSVERSEVLRRDFIANISHEMKTPMTVIAGFAEGILDGTIPPENEQRYLSAISSETRRLSRLVGNMADLSKFHTVDSGIIQEGKFDAAEVVRLALLSLEGKLEEKQLEVKAELPQTPVITRGDSDAITQVVFNLIDNAVKFSIPGGTVSISLWKQGSKAYVSVENHGETIPKEELPFIFERFHKTDKSRSADKDGVGLGLYIVKTILDKHNEDVFVTSGDGLTKFVFSLTII